MKEKKPKPEKTPKPQKTARQLEWKKRFELSLFVVMIFALLSIIGSIFYRYTGGTYTVKDAYRDLGFYDANANVNAASNVNSASNENTNSVVNTNGGENSNTNGGN